jgi:hypothetical protein
MFRAATCRAPVQLGYGYPKTSARSMIPSRSADVRRLVELGQLD